METILTPPSIDNSFDPLPAIEPDEEALADKESLQIPSSSSIKTPIQLTDTKPELRLKQLQQTAEELISTEETYVKQLILFAYDFRFAVNGLINKDRVKLIIPQVVEELCKIHRRLLKNLKKIQNTLEDDVKPIYMVFRKVMPDFSMYKRYVLIEEACISELFKEMKRNKKLMKFAKRFCKQHSTSLDTMYIAPVQRLPRYMLLFLELAKRSKGESVDYFEKAAREVHEILQKINSAKSTYDKATRFSMKLSKNARKSRATDDGVVLYQTKIRLHTPDGHTEKNMFIQPERMVFDGSDFTMVVPLNPKHMKWESLPSEHLGWKRLLLWTATEVSCDSEEKEDGVKNALNAIKDLDLDMMLTPRGGDGSGSKTSNLKSPPGYFDEEGKALELGAPATLLSSRSLSPADPRLETIVEEGREGPPSDPADPASPFKKVSVRDMYGGRTRTPFSPSGETAFDLQNELFGLLDSLEGEDMGSVTYDSDFEDASEISLLRVDSDDSQARSYADLDNNLVSKFDDVYITKNRHPMKLNHLTPRALRQLSAPAVPGAADGKRGPRPSAAKPSYRKARSESQAEGETPSGFSFETLLQEQRRLETRLDQVNRQFAQHFINLNHVSHVPQFFSE